MHSISRGRLFWLTMGATLVIVAALSAAGSFIAGERHGKVAVKEIAAEQAEAAVSAKADALKQKAADIAQTDGAVNYRAVTVQQKETEVNARAAAVALREKRLEQELAMLAGLTGDWDRAKQLDEGALKELAAKLEAIKNDWNHEKQQDLAALEKLQGLLKELEVTKAQLEVIKHRRESGSRLVEQSLHSGDLAKGERQLQGALAVLPKNDEIRFGLGMLQFVRGVERLGRSLHKYGVKSENVKDIPFLRLPVPPNAAPASISYADWRRILDDFYQDLALAESTLAKVTDDDVKVSLRLAAIRLDFVGDGKSNDRFLDVLMKIMERRRFDFLANNPEFLVGFDRGDVAWLRSYCHILMGMLDFYLAFDTEAPFDGFAADVFAKPLIREGADERQKRFSPKGPAPIPANVFEVCQPPRLSRFRSHLIQVAELNHETWKHIRAETDDDHEWLPNPKQKGVLGLPVRDAMIDNWLAVMAELQALLEGKRTLPRFLLDKNGKRLNLKTLLDDPPEKIVLDEQFPQNLQDKYIADDKEVDFGVLFRVLDAFQNFGDPFAYMFWFN